jgi:hypothetical protein
MAADGRQKFGVGCEGIGARAIRERLVEVPAGGEEVGKRGPAHEGGEEPPTVADRLDRTAEDDHRVRRREPFKRPERELDLARPPLVLDRARWQAELPEPVPNRLERVADAVEPHVGQELVAALEHLDFGRRARLALAHVLEPDLGTRESRDVELDLEACHVRVTHLTQPRKLRAELRASIERDGRSAREVDVADHPACAIGPRQYAERRRVGNDHHVGEAGELVDPEAATLPERGWEHTVSRVEAVDRAGEVRTVVHRSDRTCPGNVLAARDSVLVDENEAHGPEPELLDAGGNGGHRVRLLVGIQPVPLDESGGS